MESSIIKVAHELACRFQDENDIPERFKLNNSKKTTRYKKDTLVEERFVNHRKAWVETLKCINDNVEDSKQAWRFITINPQVVSVRSLFECKDFLDFTDFLIDRRDNDKCEDDELGKLCMLHGAFQKEIISKINIQK